MSLSRAQRAERILATAVVVVGLAGLAVSRGLAFTEAKGQFLVDVPGDYLWGRQLAFNPLGALLMIGVGLLVLGALRTRRSAVVLGVAGVAVALAVATTADLARSHPTLGSRAGNVALLLALGVGITAIELSGRPDVPPR